MKDLYVSSLTAPTIKCGKHSCCSHILLRFFHTVCCDLTPVLFGCRYHSFALQKNGHSFTAMARDGTLMCLDHIVDEEKVYTPNSTKILALLRLNLIGRFECGWWIARYTYRQRRDWQRYSRSYLARVVHLLLWPSKTNIVSIKTKIQIWVLFLFLHTRSLECRHHSQLPIAGKWSH